MPKSIKPGTKESRSFILNRAEMDEEKRTVELAFSSEEPVERWWGREILDHNPQSIRLGRLSTGAPLLSDHNNSIRSQIGVIESVSIGSDRVGRAVVRFGKSAADDEIFQKVQDGIIRNVSVGYMVHKSQLVEMEGDVDTFRVTDWEPLEISLVAVPADSTVGVGRSQDSPIVEDSPILETKEERSMPEETKPSAEDEQRAMNDKINRGIAAERKRVADILAIGSDHKDVGGIELAAKAIADERSVQEFQTEILSAIRSKPKTETPSFGQGAKVEDNIEKDGKRGFANLGDFCQSVRLVVTSNTLDPRLAQRAATTFANEGSGPDGGYSIPPEFAQGIASLALGEESLLAMTDNLPVSGNSMTYVKDEGTPWSTTGITAAWQGEAATIAQTKPSELEEDELKLKSLKVLVPATEELLADSSAMSTYITRKMGEKVDWKVQDVIINGNGSGMALGIVNSGAIVTQAKTASQTADTITAANVAKMLGRIIGGAGAREAWLIQPDAYDQIITMTLGDKPIWTPPSEGFKAAPDGFLLGRRIIKTDACQTVGDLNDIIFANMNGYRTITKAGGMEFATSMHMYFDQNMAAFRLIFRMDGGPMLSAPVTPPNSAITRSHFVNLAARA